MKLPIEYRSYVIDREDGWYVAKPTDGEPCEIGSRRLFRVMRAIDALWEALEAEGAAPTWLTDSGPINLDQPVKDRMRLFLPFLSAPKRFSAAPSQVDPPPVWKAALMVASAVAVATTMAIFAQQFIQGIEPGIIFTLIVMAVALGCGTGCALAVSAFSAFAFNFCCLTPTLTLTAPGMDEVAYVAINVTLSIMLPWLFAPRRRIFRPSEEQATARIRDTA